MLHQRLRELREFNGLTQAEVAQVLKVTRVAYDLYESNKRQISPESLSILADLYQVSADYILGREAQDMILLNDTEKDMILKFRRLDERGQQNICGILDLEYSWVNHKKESEEMVCV